MNILLSTIGRRTYIAQYFRQTQYSPLTLIGTTDRHSEDHEFSGGLLACDKGFLMPSVRHKDYIPAVLNLCAQEKISLMTSLFDLDCFELSKHLPEFKALGVVPFVSSERVNTVCFDKYETYLFLTKHQFKTPATFLSIEDFKASGLTFPVMVKPRHGFASLGLNIVNNEQELCGYFKAGVHIIQALCPGQEHSFDLFCDLDGQVLSSVVKRKIKMRAGETDQAITIKNPKLLELSIQLAGALNPTGPLDVDLFVDGDEVQILELNPRFGGGYPLSHAAGADFTGLMLDIVSGKQPKPKLGEYTDQLVMIKDMLPQFLPLAQTSRYCQPLAYGGAHA